MTIRLCALIAFSAASFLRAADAEDTRKVQVSHSEHMDFPAGGTLHVVNSTGTLTVEAWDRPEIEVTTTKSSAWEYPASEREKVAKDLESVKVSMERKGNDLVVTTNSHWYASADLDVLIKVPSSTKLIDNHRDGSVSVDGLTSDIEVTLRTGEIVLHLPQDAHYDIHAKCGIGNVNSDYAGQEKRVWFFGHKIENEASPADHRLNLKVKVGDIVLLKTQLPKYPEPLPPAPKSKGF
jgi:hypothetical protein